MYSPLIYSPAMDRTTLFLGAADRDAIRQIRERWGFGSDSAAIRFAVRVAAGLTVEPLAPAVRSNEPSPMASGGGPAEEIQRWCWPTPAVPVAHLAGAAG